MAQPCSSLQRAGQPAPLVHVAAAQRASRQRLKFCKRCRRNSISCRVSEQSDAATTRPDAAMVLVPGGAAPASCGDADSQLWAGSKLDATGDAAGAVLLERRLGIGALSVGRMAPGELGAAAVIVTRAFAGTPEAQSLRDVRDYIETLVDNSAESLVLVARLQPADGVGVPDGVAARVAGVAMLSFVPDTREKFESLQPPDDAAYLSNTAVDPAFRRQGVARALLEACEAACRAIGQRNLTLHARLADDAGRALYASSGFEDVAQDSSGWSPWRRYRPRALMAKQL